MQISPGTQLVWSLSGSEAVNLGMPMIEPDHLFCALLKFSELDDDAMENLLKDASDLASIIEERDDLALALEDLGQSTADIRHAIRKEAEHGTHKIEGNLIHRSESSRKLFQLAIDKANSQNQPVLTTHLLEIILADPTPAMNKVLKVDDGIPKWLKEPEDIFEQEEVVKPQVNWIQTIIDLAPKKGYKIAESCQPQLTIIEKSLNADNPSPVLLICDETVNAEGLLWKTAVDNNRLTLLKADKSKMLSSLAELKDPSMTGDEIVRIIEQTLSNPSTWLLFDLTENTIVDESTWNDLKPLFQKQALLILALREKMYPVYLSLDTRLEGEFRTIWLHDLSLNRSIDQL